MKKKFNMMIYVEKKMKDKLWLIMIFQYIWKLL